MPSTIITFKNVFINMHMLLFPFVSTLSTN